LYCGVQVLEAHQRPGVMGGDLLKFVPSQRRGKAGYVNAGLSEIGRRSEQLAKFKKGKRDVARHEWGARASKCGVKEKNSGQAGRNREGPGKDGQGSSFLCA